MVTPTLKVPPMPTGPVYDQVLTPDPHHWFSPSYAGISSRTEVWLTRGSLNVLELVIAGVFAHSLPLLCGAVFDLATVLFVFPLFIRRARQLGAVWYGVVALLVSNLPWHVLMVLEHTQGYEASFALQLVLVVINIVIFFPLYFLGGRYAGRKTALHRAALKGDREQVEKLLAQHPRDLSQLSENGYTARDYAQLAGHRELATELEGLMNNE